MGPICWGSIDRIASLDLLIACDKNTRNEQVKGSSPLVGSLCSVLQGERKHSPLIGGQRQATRGAPFAHLRLVHFNTRQGGFLGLGYGGIWGGRGGWGGRLGF